MGSVFCLVGFDSLLVLFLLLGCDLLLMFFLQLHTYNLHSVISPKRGSNRRRMLTLSPFILLIHQLRHKLIGNQGKHQDKA